MSNFVTGNTPDENIDKRSQKPGLGGPATPKKDVQKTQQSNQAQKAKKQGK